MRFILTTLFFTFFECIIFAQFDTNSVYLKVEKYHAQITALRSAYANHKIFPVNIELECLTALSFYPELKDAVIEFRWKDNITYTMRTVPTSSSFFFKKQLKCVIYLNRNAGNTGLKIDDLSFNAKVGWLGHELAHVTQCYSRNRWQLLFLGMKLISKKFIAGHERETDIITIKHGLGYALYEGSYYLCNNPTIDSGYLERHKKNYLSPNDILEYIKIYKNN